MKTAAVSVNKRNPLQSSAIKDVNLRYLETCNNVVNCLIVFFTASYIGKGAKMFKYALSQLFHFSPPSWANVFPIFVLLKPEVSC
jgi:hypothetical protein